METFPLITDDIKTFLPLITEYMDRMFMQISRQKTRVVEDSEAEDQHSYTEQSTFGMRACQSDLIIE